jgi:hypothetical protein
MHQVRSLTLLDPTLIQFRQLSCSCLACTARTPNFDCEQAEHVPPWHLYRLEPLNTRDAMYDSEEEFDAQTDIERICEDVQVGKNVAVPTNLPDEPFWLLICDKAVHVVQESFIDGWGTTT